MNGHDEVASAQTMRCAVSGCGLLWELVENVEVPPCGTGQGGTRTTVMPNCRELSWLGECSSVHASWSCPGLDEGVLLSGSATRMGLGSRCLMAASFSCVSAALQTRPQKARNHSAALVKRRSL